MIKIISTLILLSISACSSSSKIEAPIEKQIRSEVPTESSEETKARLNEILNQDSTITASERQHLLDLVDSGFSKNREYDILINQKKAFLIREYTKSSPNIKVIRKIKSEMRKMYAKKTDEMMSTFDKMTNIVIKHPISTQRFMDRDFQNRFMERHF